MLKDNICEHKAWDGCQLNPTLGASPGHKQDNSTACIQNAVPRLQDRIEEQENEAEFQNWPSYE